ncbi:hypothetical protein RND71_043774 [Anisodus tanguticus]|uniref:Uncharacterized protein n=1 Tax=Anisodus tanguticus TaxID=243964 RepID=A0AAE1UNN0_9SOLA|nr:hypothetical protein RND71_043774 [Anisodus tanguticus]
MLAENPLLKMEENPGIRHALSGVERKSKRSYWAFFVVWQSVIKKKLLTSALPRGAVKKGDEQENEMRFEVIRSLKFNQNTSTGVNLCLLEEEYGFLNLVKEANSTPIAMHRVG